MGGAHPCRNWPLPRQQVKQRAHKPKSPAHGSKKSSKGGWSIRRAVCAAKRVTCGLVVTACHLGDAVACDSAWH